MFVRGRDKRDGRSSSFNDFKRGKPALAAVFVANVTPSYWKEALSMSALIGRPAKALVLLVLTASAFPFFSTKAKDAR